MFKRKDDIIMATMQDFANLFNVKIGEEFLVKRKDQEEIYFISSENGLCRKIGDHDFQRANNILPEILTGEYKIIKKSQNYHVYWIAHHPGEPDVNRSDFHHEVFTSISDAFKRIHSMDEQGTVAGAWIRARSSDIDKGELVYIAGFVDSLGNRKVSEKYYGSYAG